MEQIIECNNLTHYYGKRLIYENLSFTVPKGRILGLLGKNGTGKTTTINILSGYLKPRSGECRIFGQEIQTMAPALRRNIGLLIEGHVQYQFMSITQIEKFYAAFYPNQWKKEAYYELMNKLKVATGQRISRMSCGQRSQVALGLILAQNPEASCIRRLLPRSRPRLSPPVCRLSPRLCTFRRQDCLSDFAYHSGYGTTGRRLYHDGLRKDTDSEAN